MVILLSNNGQFSLWTVSIEGIDTVHKEKNIDKFFTTDPTASKSGLFRSFSIGFSKEWW